MRTLLFFFVLIVLLVGCGDTIGEGNCIGILVTGDLMTGCLTTLSRCDDDHSYELSCTPAGQCQCTVDSKKVSTSKATSCPSNVAGMNSDCGWTLTNN